MNGSYVCREQKLIQSLGLVQTEEGFTKLFSAESPAAEESH